MDLFSKHRSAGIQGYLSRIAPLAVLLLLALPTGALGDTIHLEVSPPSPTNPPRGGTVYITASGSASSTMDEIHVASPPSGERCPQEYPEELAQVNLKWTSPIEDGWHAMTTPTYSYSFFFTEDTRPVICGYLTHVVDEEGYTAKIVAIASTEFQVLYGPSEAEVAEQYKSVQEKKQKEEAALREKKQQEEAAQRKYGEEAPSRQAAKEAAEAQTKKAAEAKAKEVAEQAPVSLLRVKAIAHPGDSSNKPGHTKIAVTTNAYAHVTVTLNHHAGTFHYRAPGKGGSEIGWSCSHPGLTYHYVVTAVGGSGAALTSSGSFRTVSATWCSNTKNREAAEAEQERHQTEDERHQAEEKHRQEVKRFDSNCEKLGGTPIELPTSEGRRIYCRGPNGGVIPVPH
jgi:hypothetical protein